MIPGAEVIPARGATFLLRSRTTSAGVAVWRAVCQVKGCPAYVEAVDRAEVREDAHEHRAAHVRGALRLEVVVFGTFGRAA